MLNKLDITNYAIIKHLEIEFFEGFTTISGETGSGKSIILSAINLLLGNKFDVTSVRDKSTKVIIEGVFNISQLSIQNFFSENDLDYEAELIIRREFTFEGKSRSFINDSPVKIKTLKVLSNYLIDIHSQHENLLINSEDYQIKLLDQFAIEKFDNFSNSLNNYFSLFQKLKNYEFDLLDKKKLLLNNNYDLDFYKNIIKEVELLDLQDSEEKDLHKEHNKLNNIHHIKTTITELIFQLEEADYSIINQLNLLNSKMSNISTYDDRLVALLDRLKGNTIDINDVLMDIHSFNQNLNIDHGRLEYIEHRINTINSLEKKLNVIGVDGVLKKINAIKSDVQDMFNISHEIEIVEKKIIDLKGDLLKLADDVSFMRKKSAIDLAHAIEGDLFDLGISNPSLSFSFSRNSELLSHGYDSITLLFSANKGYDMLPVNKIASGGEIARLMLCVKKYLFGMLNFSTIIFDEIDSGVSGKIGRKMGRILQQMSSRGQIICVTHLPQIASLGDVHYKVFKKDIGESLDATVLQLSNDDRIIELARMLSGDQVNEEAIANAKKMLDI